MEPMPITSKNCSSSIQPRRWSGQGIGQRSSSGAQNNLRVYGSSASPSRPIMPSGIWLAVSQPCSSLLPTIRGIPLATPSSPTLRIRRQLLGGDGSTAGVG